MKKRTSRKMDAENGNFRCSGNNFYYFENTWVNTVVMVMGT